jgi:hypothetical protein
MLLILFYLSALPSDKALALKTGRWMPGHILEGGASMALKNPSKAFKICVIKGLKASKKWCICMNVLVKNIMSARY